MRTQIIATLLFFSIIGCTSRKKEVIIEGNIIGKGITNIEYTIPVNEIFNVLMTDSVKPDTAGNFRLIIPFEKAGFIILRPLYNASPIYKTQGIIIAEPGHTYTISFDATVDNNSFNVQGFNEEALNLYNTLPNPILLNELQGTVPFMRDSVAASIEEKVTSLKEKEIAMFSDLLENGKISEDFFRLVRVDRDCYYSVITAMVIENKYSTTTRNANFKFTKEQREIYFFKDEMRSLWERAFQQPAFPDYTICSSPWWYSYYQRLTYFKLYNNNDINPTELVELSRKSLVKTYHIENGIKKYLPSEIVESYFANYIFNNCFLFREFQDFELITLYDQFVSEYPNSVYTRYLTPWIKQFKDYQVKISKPEINDKIILIENYQNINNLGDCLSGFKGKKVFVDVWATWCGPCRSEFAKAEKIREILKSENAVFIYISIDEDRYDKTWNDMIKYYNLEGYHIRANKSLVEDIKKIQGNENGLYVPWHIFFNEEGIKKDIPPAITKL